MSKEELEATSPLEEYLAEVVAGIIEDKIGRGVSPSHADLQETLAKVKEDATEALRRMVRSKLLTCHTTLNSTSFSFTPPK